MPCAQLYTLADTTQLPQPARFGSYSRAQLVSPDRRNLFVTPWFSLLLGYMLHGHEERAGGWIIKNSNLHTTLSKLTQHSEPEPQEFLIEKTFSKMHNLINITDDLI